MNQKEEIRKELNEYLDNYIPRTEVDIYKHVVNFIKKDRAEQLILYGVSQQRELLLDYEEWLNEYPNLKDRKKQVDKYLNK